MKTILILLILSSCLIACSKSEFGEGENLDFHTDISNQLTKYTYYDSRINQFVFTISDSERKKYPQFALFIHEQRMNDMNASLSPIEYDPIEANHTRAGKICPDGGVNFVDCAPLLVGGGQVVIYISQASMRSMRYYPVFRDYLRKCSSCIQIAGYNIDRAAVALSNLVDAPNGTVVILREDDRFDSWAVGVQYCYSDV